MASSFLRCDSLHTRCPRCMRKFPSAVYFGGDFTRQFPYEIRVFLPFPRALLGIFVAQLKHSPGYVPCIERFSTSTNIKGRSHVTPKERVLSLSGRTWATACRCNILLGLRKTSRAAGVSPPRSNRSRRSSLKPNGSRSGNVSTNAITNVQRYASAGIAIRTSPTPAATSH